jgi:hypothetical protein
MAAQAETAARRGETSEEDVSSSDRQDEKTKK